MHQPLLYSLTAAYSPISGSEVALLACSASLALSPGDSEDRLLDPIAERTDLATLRVSECALGNTVAVFAGTFCAERLAR